MKPYKIFLIFLGFLLLIALLAYVFPKEGIKIGKDMTLNFPSLEKIFQQEETNYKDISNIVMNNLPVDTMIQPLDTLVRDTARMNQDTLPDVKARQDTIPVKEESNREIRREPLQTSLNFIEYPDNDPSTLYPFFENLENLKESNSLIRILHYGDSQIEGDRISSYLRNQLQKQFGGSGLGLIPVVLPFNTNIPLKHNISKEWERYTVRQKTNFQHRKYGVLLSFSRFSPYYSHYQNEVYESHIKLESSPLSYDLVSEFTQCRIFYGLNEKPFIVKLEYQGEIADADMIPPTRELKEISWNLPQTLDEFTLTFNGDHSPNIYGIALDGNQGIAVDNIPLRGSQGTDFTRTDLQFYKEMLKKLNVKLILMHFGVNVVPTLRDNYQYYEDEFYKQLSALKSLDEDLTIVVMGVTDMSRKVGGTYESYPDIEMIRDAQKEAAFRAGCAFWDTYEAMGGNNSMPSWVFADPPLARKDFTHFTYKGSIVVAKMFYKALMNDYFQFQEVRQNQTVSEKTDTT